VSRVPLRLLLVLAARSLWAHKVKSLIVGSILFFGTFLVVLGGALLSSVQDSMTRSITGSMSGHLQIYAADAEDELALFGGMGMGTPNYGEIPNFADAAGALSDVENVAAIVPMGITTATIFGPSELDRVLEKLRAAIEADDAASPARFWTSSPRPKRSSRTRRSWRKPWPTWSVSTLTFFGRQTSSRTLRPRSPSSTRRSRPSPATAA
jgi:hypothetical protein